MDENATNSKNTDNKAKKPYIEDDLTGADQIELLYKKQRFQEKMILGHQKSLDRIRRARMKNPVSLECPRCGGGRELYRFTGVVRCPFCDSVEELPEVHRFIPEIDDPRRKPQRMPKVYLPNQNPSSAKNYTFLSIIAGGFSLYTLGMLFFIEIFGLILGIIALIKLHKRPETKHIYIEALVGFFLNLAALVLYLCMNFISIAFDF